jgi:Rrf2 family nitric oxide-sensitive transcriptional repressor
MRLTAYTDYALRTLLYLAARPERLVTIAEIADYHDIPKNHLTKVVHQLGQTGVLRTVRGRQGGIALGAAPEEIRIGEVVRGTEDVCMAPCFSAHAPACPEAGRCGLQGVLGRATRAWMAELDGVTLAEVIKGQTRWV